MSEAPIDLSPHPPSTPCLDEGLDTLLARAGNDIRKYYETFQQRVRESPAQAVLVAVAAGYLLHRLPVRAIVVAKVRILTALAPPALVLYGAAKMCEFVQCQRKR